MENENAIELKPKRRNQVQYGRAEEIFNVVSHLVGAALAIIMAVLVIVFCSINAYRGKYDYPALAITSVSIYGVTVILMFLMSTLYHSRKFGGRARSVFRRFDHCSIPLLIAGTYAPVTLIGLVNNSNSNADFVWGIVIFSIVLLTAIVTVVFNAINVHKFRHFALCAYVLMGWAALIRIYHIALAIGAMAFTFVLLGGVVYTAGIILYRSKKIKFNHAIWHLFVLAGSIFHFAAIFFFLI